MKLLLVEDNADLAKWLSTALTKSGYAVDVVNNGLIADSVLATGEYDIIILDRLMPSMDGMTILRRLRQRRSGVPVLMLTAMAAMKDRVAGIDEGADDYLTKPFELPELEARLRALVRRSQGRHNALIEFGPLRYDEVSRAFTVSDRLMNLTPREHSVLEFMLQRSGKPVAKDTLFERVFSQDATAGIDAIEIYVHRLRKKLDGSGVRIVTLRGLGYLLEQENGSNG